MPTPSEPSTLLIVTTAVVLLGIAVYQITQLATMAASRVQRRGRFVAVVVAGAWLAYGGFFVGVVARNDSYVDALPFVVAGLYAPTIAALVALRFSGRFRRFVDGLPLRWLISTVESWPRMIVGVVFLIWFFAGALPAVFALVAGPGDWLAGFFARRSMKRLEGDVDPTHTRERDWSVGEIAAGHDAMPAHHRTRVAHGARAVWFVVLFGIADFIAAPASSAVSIQLGDVPEQMGRFPMALIPLFLVPQVLVLEVLALRQLRSMQRAFPIDHTTRQPHPIATPETAEQEVAA